MKSEDRVEAVALESGVVEFLKAHPDFFVRHGDLLEDLSLPHASGGAISLVARQIDVLREKNSKLQDRMDGLLEIARENDGLYQRIHQLTLTLLDAQSLEDVLASLDWGLHQFFHADFSAVRILEPLASSPILHLFTPKDHSFRAQAERQITLDQPLCGRPAAEWASYLFGQDHDQVGSFALIRLHHAGLRGLFAMGSRDPGRFHSDMGWIFLKQMSEVLAVRMAPLMKVDQG